MSRPRKAFRDGVKRVADQGAGVFEVVLVDYADLSELLLDAALGDREAAVQIGIVRGVVDSIRKAPTDKPKLCVACPRPLQAGNFLCGCVRPARPDPADALGFGLCKHCAANPEQTQDKVMAGLLRMWPDIRTLPIAARDIGRLTSTKLAGAVQ